MYDKPLLIRFGTFRELTNQGRYGALDTAAVRADGSTDSNVRGS